MIAITVDPPDRNAKVAKKLNLDFPVLSDPEMKVIDAFGVRHARGKPGGGDIARPAAFLVDREGKIVWRFLTDNWRVRLRAGDAIDAIGRMQ